MNELPSAQFRTKYAKLKEPTAVTVNGHVVGWWMPAEVNGKEFVLEGWGDYASVGRNPLTKLPGGGVQARQAQRDALLGKINRSK